MFDLMMMCELLMCEKIIELEARLMKVWLMIVCMSSELNVDKN